jgi:formylglycine-generating enzyme required for sulfatase activity
MQTFWAAHGEAVIVGIVVALAAAILFALRQLLTHAVQKFSDWIASTRRGQGAAFPRRYLKAMVERHGRLRLIGIYNQGDLHPPRLREVFISLRVAVGQEDGPKMGWSEALGPKQKRVVILGAPGAGKTTLLDYLVLVLAGQVRHPNSEKPQHTLYLPTFYLGRYPVTVGEFRAFLLATGTEVEDSASWDKWNREPNHPFVGVSWHEALAYARWHGMGLPSEAEWEKGARGTDGRNYPWGNEWQVGRANNLSPWRWNLAHWLFRSFGQYRLTGKTTPIDAFSPRGDSPYGCSDMVGNVWEWTRSLLGSHHENFYYRYPYVPSDGREDLESPSLRVLRGGTFSLAPMLVRCPIRNGLSPANRSYNIGLRVAVSPFSL